MTAVRAEWLTVGGPIEPWTRLGLVAVDGLIPLFGTGIRVTGDERAGIVGWALSGLDEAVADIDGLVTDAVPAAPPVLVEHPLSAF